MNFLPDLNNILLETKNLAKHFDSFCAVDRVSFQIPPRICFGFLGPNGAGKTTTIKMIYGALLPTSGDIRVFGLPVESHRKTIKRQLGIVHQKDILQESLSAWENLYVYGRHFGLPKQKIREEGNKWLAIMELQDRAEEAVYRFSGGMKRRLSIVKALLNHPRLLLLDEPTTGLDPQSRHNLWQVIRDIRGEGVTLLLTTHYMEEAEFLCDTLLIMDKGRIIEEGTPPGLIQKHGCKNLEEVFLKLTGKELRDE